MVGALEGARDPGISKITSPGSEYSPRPLNEIAWTRLESLCSLDVCPPTGTHENNDYLIVMRSSYQCELGACMPKKLRYHQTWIDNKVILVVRHGGNGKERESRSGRTAASSPGASKCQISAFRGKVGASHWGDQEQRQFATTASTRTAEIR